MKKIISVICIIAAAMLVLTACKKTENKQPEPTKGFDPSQVKAMGDILIYENEGDYQEAYSEKKFVYVFTVNGLYYRASADLPKEVSEAIWADESGEDRDQKVRDLLSSLKVTSFENLSEKIPAQAELDKLVGKTGKELFDDGWTYWSYNLEDMEAGMNHGAFSYMVRFQYDGEQMVNSDDFDFYKEFKDLPVKSVKFEGLGDAANPE